MYQSSASHNPVFIVNTGKEKCMGNMDQAQGNTHVFVKVGQNHFNHEIRCTVSKQQDANQPFVIQAFILFVMKMLAKQG